MWRRFCSYLLLFYVQGVQGRVSLLLGGGEEEDIWLVGCFSSVWVFHGSVQSVLFVVLASQLAV